MKYILILALFVFCTNHYELSMFYCGFSQAYCGQSVADDVYDKASFVILAFANTIASGAVVCDTNHFPAKQIQGWKRAGKKVLISVGGQNGNWTNVFATETHRKNFITSFTDIVYRYDLDGVDLDIQQYSFTPRIVAQTIIDLRAELNKKAKKIIIVSPQDVTVYQGTPTHSPDSAGQPFNYFVPIIDLADSAIDFYQPQAYNNWYDGLAGGSLDYYKDVYLNWRNMQGVSPWTRPIQNFKGVDGRKLMIGLMASSTAGIPDYYGTPETIQAFKDFLRSSNYPLKGFMMWNSHWDQLNKNAISKACTS